MLGLFTSASTLQPNFLKYPLCAPILNKKNIIKKILLSLPGFYQTACFFTKKINPRIFVYHRFCNASDKSHHKMDGKTFEWQLGQIIKSHKVITLGEYFQLRINGEKIPKNLVVVTIDDGYHDFYETAYPILKKLKLNKLLLSFFILKTKYFSFLYFKIYFLLYKWYIFIT